MKTDDHLVVEKTSQGTFVLFFYVIKKCDCKLAVRYGICYATFCIKKNLMLKNSPIKKKIYSKVHGLDENFNYHLMIFMNVHTQVNIKVEKFTDSVQLL